MAGTLPGAQPDPLFNSLTNMKDGHYEIPDNKMGLRNASNTSVSRSAGRTPDNFLSFRALSANEEWSYPRGDTNSSPNNLANSSANQSRRIDSNWRSRPQSVDLFGGSYDGGLSTADDRTPLLMRPRSSSYDVSSQLESTSQLLDSTPINRPRRKRVTDAMRSLNLWPMDRKRVLSLIKIGILFVVTILCCIFLLLQEEHEPEAHFTILPQDELYVLEKEHCEGHRRMVRATFRGPFLTGNKEDENLTKTMIFMDSKNVVNLTINPDALNHSEATSRTVEFKCHEGQTYIMSAQSETRIPFDWSINMLPVEVEHEVVFAFIILIFVYVLIIFEIVHRTLAAMLGALAALAVLSILNQRPSMEVIISWIDMETLTLLFGMMIIVAIFADTGFFDYSALKAYKLAKGQVWPLITLLCVFSAFVSAFLDNVTTILLMTPVTIKLCEVLNLDPRRILIAEVLFSNIGGTATAIGDPPNVIIVGSLSSKGIGFATFTVHMFPGIIAICFLGYGVLRLYYRDISLMTNKDPADISEIKHEVAMWRRAAGRMTAYTREETVMRALFLQKAVEAEHVLNKTIHKNRRSEQQSFYTTLKKLEQEYCIKDVALLVKCGVVLGVVMLLLFTYSFIDTIHTDIGWIAVLGSLWLLVLADIHDFEGILHKVEWATLLFFAGLFILMEALGELGLMKTIGDAIANLISTAEAENRLLVALVLILWVSAIASSFIDNIPYTTAMVPILQQLADKPELDLPLLPMVIALAMGACLGGNGTLIGASCNVVCAGIADQHGYGFTFKEFFKVGFPMMLVTTVGATAYVLICHCVIEWNSI